MKTDTITKLYHLHLIWQLYATYSCNTTSRLVHHLWRWITMCWSELLFEEMVSNRTSVNFNWTPLLQTESGMRRMNNRWVEGRSVTCVANPRSCCKWIQMNSERHPDNPPGWDVLNVTYTDNYKVLNWKTSVMDSHECLLRSNTLYFIGISWKIDCVTQCDIEHINTHEQQKCGFGGSVRNTDCISACWCSYLKWTSRRTDN